MKNYEYTVMKRARIIGVIGSIDMLCTYAVSVRVEGHDLER